MDVETFANECTIQRIVDDPRGKIHLEDACIIGIDLFAFENPDIGLGADGDYHFTRLAREPKLLEALASTSQLLAPLGRPELWMGMTMYG